MIVTNDVHMYLFMKAKTLFNKRKTLKKNTEYDCFSFGKYPTFLISGTKQWKITETNQKPGMGYNLTK